MKREKYKYFFTFIVSEATERRVVVMKREGGEETGQIMMGDNREVREEVG